MSGRTKTEANHPPNTASHEKILHSLSLLIFSENGTESAAALNELYRWSTGNTRTIEIPHPGIQQPPQPPQSPPQPTPMLIMSLTNFIHYHISPFKHGPTIKPAITALDILSNLVRCTDRMQSLTNSILLSSIRDTVLLLHRLSFCPNSPLRKHSQDILIQIAKFCNITNVMGDYTSEFISSLCSIFMLLDPSEDDSNLIIFMNFALLPDNCRLIIDEIGVETMVTRISQLLSFPSTPLRDLLLECVYLFCMTIPDFKDAVCNSHFLLRSLVTLSIPPFMPYETKFVVPFTPCQKACVVLLELCDDSRVSSYLARFKMQLADAVLKWKSCGLPELALKLSNISPR
ncbi:hypothetical protein GPJ56_002543 [Histomonas meleagridis]|uniref:uncharacterized protein n=1 Tax=Histomonas meleagridis TaxID=135588 RepID=UPI003559AA7D|nr:hypothetical protein GPJ56_002543 [Histomonas meleagridis]KAH0801335.1 hypothetical protein GO595_005930 [Histomonas meleagridis]